MRKTDPRREGKFGSGDTESFWAITKTHKRPNKPSARTDGLEQATSDNC